MRSRGICRTCLAVLILALGVGEACPRAAADVEETGARLEAAGVDAPTRERILDAVGRATEFLLSRQQKNGSFEEHWKHGDRRADADPIQTTLLCALALRHVGGEATEEPVRRAASWVLAQDSECWGAIDRNVRSAALALMLRDATRDLDLPVEALAKALARALDDETGYWSHALHSASGPPMPGIESCQYAVLGLWAARRQGVDVPAAVWKRHARALGEEQTRTGSWRSHPDTALEAMGFPPDPRDMGTPVGRYVGLTNLRLASEALQGSGIGQSVLRRTVRRALRRIDSDTVDVLHDPADFLATARLSTGQELTFPRREGSRGRPGRGAYQKLWAMSQACIFHDVEHYQRAARGSRRPEKRSWYLDAADWFLRVQDASGGWSPTAGNPVTPPSEIDTAHALLFLVRSAAAMHPTKPRPVDAPPPGSEDASE